MKLIGLSKSKLLTGALIVCVNVGISQINKSTSENYKERVVNSRYDYATSYDNGYVTLRDGTTLYGQISLGGKSYDKVSVVRIRTNAGKRYALSPRSLKEYGLVNSLVNDTPDLFKWEQLNERSAATGFQDIRTGSADFGYVKTKEGKTYEGELTLKEVNGKIRHVVVKKGDQKNKLSAEEISNFGVKQYVDEKFVGVWSIVQWKKSMGSGMLVNTKSIPAQGKVTLTDGSTQSGFITIVKKNEITTQLQVSDSPDGKKGQKVKYKDVKSYTIEQRMSDFDAMLKKLEIPYDVLHPSQKFHPGAIELLDGTIIEGQIAKAANSDYTDIYFAKDINSIIKGYPAAEIEYTVQTISDETMAVYEANLYDYNHAQDYLIQRPAQWKIASKDEMGYVTEFQQGYLIMTTGEEKVGALSVTESNGAYRFVLMEDGKKVKYSNKEVIEHGLIVNEANTAFSRHLFYKKRPGFVRLTGSKDYIKGDLKLKTTAGSETNIHVDGKKYNLEGVDIYGFSDVPVSDMTRKGNLIYDDPKRNFHPGSFTINGESKEGFIAWSEPNGAGEYKSFFFADKMDGVANVYYLNDGATNVNQSIQPRSEDDDSEVSNFYAANDTTMLSKSKGYIITPNGEQIGGEIQLVTEPKKWFPSDVLFTGTDGVLVRYNAENPLAKFVLMKEGDEQEYISYGEAYVEVLDRDGDLVHIRNPFPTTNSIAADFLNSAIQSEENAINAEYERKAAIAEAEGRPAAKVSVHIDDIMIYANEFLIYDEATGRTTMYIPKQFYYLVVEAELEGCIEYLTANRSEQASLKKMKNPLGTLMFLNENMNN